MTSVHALSSKRLTLVAATLGSFVVLLESTAVGVALPAIRAELGGGLESQQWIVNAYLLTLGSLILIGGSLGDIFGERRMFVAGTAGFGVLSAGPMDLRACSSMFSRARRSSRSDWRSSSRR